MVDQKLKRRRHGAISITNTDEESTGRSTFQDRKNDDVVGAQQCKGFEGKIVRRLGIPFYRDSLIVSCTPISRI